MSDLQLLTYLLALAGDGEEAARATAHTLLNSYDSLSTVLTLPRSTLLNDPRLSESSAAFLALVGAMSFRYADRFHRSDLVVMDAVAVSRLLAPHFQGHAVERVCAICVDRDFHLLGSGAVVTHGDADNTALPIRRILSLALSSEAYGVILAHNHPDGAPFFSQADLMTTHVLRGKLAVLGVSLLDHYIWASDRAISLYEQLRAATPPPPLDHWRRRLCSAALSPRSFSPSGRANERAARAERPLYSTPTPPGPLSRSNCKEALRPSRRASFFATVKWIPQEKQ